MHSSFRLSSPEVEQIKHTSKFDSRKCLPARVQEQPSYVFSNMHVIVGSVAL